MSRRAALAAALRRHGRPLLLAGIAAIVLGTYLASWAGLTTEQRSTRDFSSVYTAATIIRQGHAQQLYDVRLQQRVGDAAMAPHHLSFPYQEVGVGAALAVP